MVNAPLPFELVCHIWFALPFLLTSTTQNYIIFIYCFHYWVYFNILFSVYLTFQGTSHKPAWNNAGDFLHQSDLLWCFCSVLLTYRGINCKNQKNKIKANSYKHFTLLFLCHLLSQWKLGKKNKDIAKTRWHANQLCCCISSPVHSNRKASPKSELIGCTIWREVIFFVKLNIK